jgi:SAM-dependent methyltransferase
MVEFWNGESTKRWVQFQDTMDASMAPLGIAAMDAIGIADEDRVIDIGCGCGDTSLELARRVEPKGAVLGLDISEPMTGLAGDRVSDSPHDNIELALADAQVHAFEPGARDAVFSRFGIMFFDQPVAAFENLKAALVTGSRIGFVCWQAAKANEWVRVPSQIAAAHIQLPPPNPPDQPGEFGFANKDFVYRNLDQAGFVDIEIADHTVPMRMAGGDTVEDVVGFVSSVGPMARAIAEADPGKEVVEQITDDLRDVLTNHYTGDGVVMSCATWVVTARTPA